MSHYSTKSRLTADFLKEYVHEKPELMVYIYGRMYSDFAEN